MNYLSYRNIYKAYYIFIGMKDSKIKIFVIDNTGSWPGYFCLDLINLYTETLKEYPNTTIETAQACSVNEMRNFACRNAIGKRGKRSQELPERVDYLVQLDTDHHYPPTFIIDMMKHDKDVITGCTSSRYNPYQQTQFKKFQYEFRVEDNIVNPSKDESLRKIAASGPVGMIIKTDVLDKLKYPYYKINHIGHEDSRPTEAIQGGDIYFSKQLKKAGIDLWLDPKVTFPHQVTNVFVNRGQLQL